MDRTVLTLGVDSSQVGTAAAAFKEMTAAGNTAAASGAKVTEAAKAQGKAIATELTPAAKKGKGAFNELSAAAEKLSKKSAAADPLVDTIRKLRKPRVVQEVDANFVGPLPLPKPARTRRAPPEISVPAESAAASILRLTAEAGKAKPALASLVTTVRSTGTAFDILTRKANATYEAIGRFGARPFKIPVPQGMVDVGRALADLNRANPNALAQVSAALAEAERQAKRTAGAVTTVIRSVAASRTAFAEASRTPLGAPTPVSLFTRNATPPASVAQLAGEAGRAQKAVDRLTAAARTQRSALAQLAPAAATTAASYREIATSPITLAAPQGLAAAASTLATLLATTIQPRQPQQAAGPQRNALAAAAARELAEGNREVASSARLAAFQQQQLAFQVNDFFVQVASGGSALTALIQQGSQLSGTFGGIGNAFRALGALITPARLAMGGAAAAAGTLAAAYYEGSRQSKAFSDALVLTGNYAGQTAGKVNALAREVAASGQVSISAARGAAQAVLSTGEIGPQVFGAAAEAVALYAEATGKTAEEVAKDFASMARSPSKFAAEMNKSMNFITSAQYDAIKALEDGGEAAEAQARAFGALNNSLRSLDPNFGAIERALRGTKNAWKGFWDAAYDIGRTETVEDKLKNVQDRIAYTDSQLKVRPTPARPFTLPNGLGKSAQDVLKEQHAELRDVNQQLFKEGERVAEAARKKELDKEAIAANAILEIYSNKNEQFKKKRGELERAFKAKADVGSPISAADQKAAFEQLNKQFAPAGSGNGASDALRAQADRDIRGFQAVLDLERDAFAFQNRFLQGEYQAGNISLREFYDRKRQDTKTAVAAEIAELEKERVRLEQLRGAIKDPTKKAETQDKLNENANLQIKVKANADRDITLSNQEETASFKQLSDTITNYRANLLQMQGDELGAAALRSQIEIRGVGLLAAQSGGQITQEDIDKQTKLSEAARVFAKVQQDASLLSNNASRAQEAFALAAEESGKGLIETERGIFAIRAKELEQLGALASAAKALAEASTVPAVKQFAADLALEYAKAAKAIDPALQRLRDANKDLAAGIAGTISDGPSAIAAEYARQRTAASADVKSQRDFYDRKVELLEGYLATTQDKNDKARLREKIKAAEAQRDNAKGESKGSSLLGSIGDAVLKPIGEQLFATTSKLLIQDPLQDYLKAQLTKLTEGKGALAGIFGDALGIKEDPKQAAQVLQTAAINSSTTALDLLAKAAQAAAGAVSTPGAGIASPTAANALAPASDTPVVAAQSQAAATILSFSKEATAATSVVQNLAIAVGEGTGALGRLPAIVNLFQSIVAAMSTSSAGSSGSGLFGAIAGLFSGGGGSEAGYESMAAYGQYHSGGIVGTAPATRSMASSAFAGAPRYHTGGIAGQAADKLKINEVAAILMGGPKGKREEVLTADDPRHRDNLGMNVLAQIMAESKAGMRVKGARELGGPVSANSMYRVNEKGPELLQVAGKQYLMTGSQGGNVKANEGAREQRPVVVNNNFAIAGQTSQASQSQIAAAAARGVARGGRRGN